MKVYVWSPGWCERKYLNHLVLGSIFFKCQISISTSMCKNVSTIVHVIILVAIPTHTQKVARWWFQIFFIFVPICGNDPILMGWTHQLGCRWNSLLLYHYGKSESSQSMISSKKFLKEILVAVCSQDLSNLLGSGFSYRKPKSCSKDIHCLVK